jgi:ArsR family transcriptional regulator
MVSLLPLVTSDVDDGCVPVSAEAMPLDEAVRLAGRLKAIAEPTRLRLLSLVAAHEGQEACVCDLTEPVQLSQPTVSHHLKILVEAGLLSRSKRGSWAFYAVVPEALDGLADMLRASVAGSPSASTADANSSSTAMPAAAAMTATTLDGEYEQ